METLSQDAIDIGSLAPAIHDGSGLNTIEWGCCVVLLSVAGSVFVSPHVQHWWVCEHLQMLDLHLPDPSVTGPGNMTDGLLLLLFLRGQMVL